MPIQDEQDRHRAATWSAVRTLWNAFGDKPDEVIVSMYPDLPAFLDETFKQQQTPEWTAIQIVAQVANDHLAQSFTAEQRQEMLAELGRLAQASFEEAQGYPAYPLVHALVSAWQITQTWIGEGKVDGSASQFLLGRFVSALAAGPK
jgi:hypothetical protein